MLRVGWLSPQGFRNWVLHGVLFVLLTALKFLFGATFARCPMAPRGRNSGGFEMKLTRRHAVRSVGHTTWAVGTNVLAGSALVG